MNALRTRAPEVTGTHVAKLLASRTSALVQRASGAVEVVLDLTEALTDPAWSDADVVWRSQGWVWADELLTAAQDQAEELGTSTSAVVLRAAAGREGTAELAAELARIEASPTVPARELSPSAPVTTSDVPSWAAGMYSQRPVAV